MKYLLKIVGTLLLIILGGISIFLTLSVIFDLFGIREKEGNYVLPIVYANLVAGISYLYAAYQKWNNPRMAFYVLIGTTAILLAVFIWLKTYIAGGGIHEEKTVSAMIFRIVFTLVIALVSYFLSRKPTVANIQRS